MNKFIKIILILFLYMVCQSCKRTYEARPFSREDWEIQTNTGFNSAFVIFNDIEKRINIPLENDPVFRNLLKTMSPDQIYDMSDLEHLKPDFIIGFFAGGNVASIPIFLLDKSFVFIFIDHAYLVNSAENFLSIISTYRQNDIGNDIVR